MDTRKYPSDWNAISRAVRDAAGNKCQRCGVANGSAIFRTVDGKAWYDAGQDCYFEYPSGEKLPDWFDADMREKMTVVVLTVAHVGPNKHDKMDCTSLESLCQSCHLAEDLQDHIANRKRTAMAKKAAGDLFAQEATT